MLGIQASRYHWLLAGALLSLGLPALVIAGFGGATAASFALEYLVHGRLGGGGWLPLFWLAGGLLAAACLWFLVRWTVRSGGVRALSLGLVGAAMYVVAVLMMGQLDAAAQPDDSMAGMGWGMLGMAISAYLLLALAMGLAALWLERRRRTDTA